MMGGKPLPTLESRSQLQKAFQARAQGQPDEAISLLNGLVERMPDHAEGWFQLGIMYQDRGRFQFALTAFEACLKIRPKSEWAYFRIGVIYSTLNRKLAALNAFHYALEAGPGFAEIRVNLGATLVALGWWDAARRALLSMDGTLKGWWASARETALSRWRSEHRQALTLLRARRDGSYDRAGLASSLLSLGKFRAVSAITREWHAEHPKDFAPTMLHVRLLVRTEGLASALEFLASRTDDFENVAAFHNLYSELLFEDGSYRAAMDAAQQAEALARDVLDRRRKAQLFVVAERWSDLLDLSVKWMDETKDTTPYRFALAAYRETGRVGRVDELATMKRRPENWLKLVQFWDQSDLPADVRGVIGTWPKANPDLPCILFDEARALAFLLGTHGHRALAAFDACHHPAMKSDFFRTAYLWRHGGIFVDADESCRRAIIPIFAALEERTLVASLSGDAAPYVHSWCVAARPNCPILGAAFEEMISLIERDRRSNRQTDIWSATGPGLLTRAIARNLSSDTPESVGLMDLSLYRTLVTTHEALAYKATPMGNWRSAGD